MKPYWQDNSGVLYQGDVLAVLKELPAESVDCAITSPPYWGLRDYGTAKWEGGDPNCNHKKAKEKSRYDYDLSKAQTGTHARAKEGTDQAKWKDECPSCGALKVDHQLGLEKTPEEYVAKMVEVFREVKRVLKKDGTLWLNLGDSYSGNCSRTSTGGCGMGDEREGIYTKTGDGLKPKDLCGIPWRVAFALQADGWYLRQDIIWAKPNPMPESVTDRCTKSHEYVFLLTKSPKYYFDAEAIKEKAAIGWNESEFNTGKTGGHQLGRSSKKPRQFGATKQEGTMRQDVGRMFEDNGTRNKRSVWNIATQPFPDAHFATFPPDLITPMIKAGTKEKGIVLDPFMGSGTTAAVAKDLGRNYLGIDLNPKYLDMAVKRLRQEVLFTPAPAGKEV